MIGQTISHYKILEKLGEGGMGVVYKAQDSSLDRLVALKFLPSRISSSTEDKARFIQEAKAAASLSHPNICTIFGVEEHDEQTFIVMEYVEGKTLKDMKTNIPLKEAIDIGIQLADGLAAAHEKGIVHRDVKPENIMIRKDGRVQIMDFGLAKLKGASRLTKEGSTVGTAGYMSPEQVQGQETDHRSDIFSFGVVLYELLTGQSPFRGVHETAIAYEIVNVVPVPASSIKADIDPMLDAIVLDCLEKDPRERYQSSSEVGRTLRRFKKDSSRTRLSRITAARQPYEQNREGPSQAFSGKFLGYNRLPWIVAGVFLLITASLGIIHFSEQQRYLVPIRSFIMPPPGEKFSGSGNRPSLPALSPDGRVFVFAVAANNGEKMLWVRAVGEPEARPLAGTEGATYPFWSPDNKSIGFFAQGNLKTVSREGGSPATLATAPNGLGGSWNQEGTIIFAPHLYAQIFRVSSAGGGASPITSLDTTRKESSHRWPYFLPDGKHFLFLARTIYVGLRPEAEVLYVQSIESGERKMLEYSSYNAAFAAGFLFTCTNGSLLARSFDTSTLTLAGKPVPLVENIQINRTDGYAVFSVSITDVLAYQSSRANLGSKLVIFDRLGKQISIIGERDQYWDVRFSMNDHSVAYSLVNTATNNMDIWTYDLESGTRTRITFDPAQERKPLWSPDGKKILYLSNRNGMFGFYLKGSNGLGEEELIFASPENKHPSDWSADGKYVVYSALMSPDRRSDILILPMTGVRKPFPIAETEGNEWDPRFSPDGTWIAYMSDESGQNEVYVRRLTSGRKWQISRNGGARPRWANKGKEIYFMNLDDVLMMARLAFEGEKVHVSSIQPLFQSYPTTFAGNYDITSDGKRFLINSTFESELPIPYTLLYHWSSLTGTRQD